MMELMEQMVPMVLRAMQELMERTGPMALRALLGLMEPGALRVLLGHKVMVARKEQKGAEVQRVILGLKARQVLRESRVL